MFDENSYKKKMSKTIDVFSKELKFIKNWKSKCKYA